jgi:hypothetical protein
VVGSIRDVDIRLLRIFFTIAKSGGFSRAQAKLNLSQSAISTHMAQLETRLGTRLCQRGHGAFEITDGQIVAEGADFNIGDYLHIGAVSLQITAPRIPCNTFATRMNDPEWVKKFRHAGRPGLYCRVIKEGTIHAGDSVLVEKYSGKTVSIAESYRDYYDRNKTKETIRRHLKAPLATRLRKILEDELQKLIVSN